MKGVCYMQVTFNLNVLEILLLFTLDIYDIYFSLIFVKMWQISSQKQIEQTMIYPLTSLAAKLLES